VSIDFFICYKNLVVFTYEHDQRQRNRENWREENIYRFRKMLKLNLKNYIQR